MLFFTTNRLTILLAKVQSTILIVDLSSFKFNLLLMRLAHTVSMSSYIAEEEKHSYIVYLNYQ